MNVTKELRNSLTPHQHVQFFSKLDNDRLRFVEYFMTSNPLGSPHVFLSLFSSVGTGLSVYRDKYTLSHYAAAGGETRGSQCCIKIIAQ